MCFGCSIELSKLDSYFEYIYICHNIYFGCSKVLSLQDGSLEHSQHMLWFKNRKLFFHYAHLSGSLINAVNQFLRCLISQIRLIININKGFVV